MHVYTLISCVLTEFDEASIARRGAVASALQSDHETHDARAQATPSAEQLRLRDVS
jgi:hypothetical protein